VLRTTGFQPKLESQQLTISELRSTKVERSSEIYFTMFSSFGFAWLESVDAKAMYECLF
jgi:hypothetical protein